MNSIPFKLITINPSLEANDGFHAKPRDIKAVKVAFKHADEEQVTATLSSLDDTSCFSTEVEAVSGNGEFISPLRTHCLLAFDYTNIQTALEISNDYGNFCRVLAENTDVTESIKVNTNAARSSAYRCADLSNVGIVNAELSDINIPENYYDLVVLSDIETLTDDAQSSKKLLSRATKALTKKGVLVLVTQNPKPVSAWFNQDQEIPYLGLYRAQNNCLPQSEWLSLLEQTGLDKQNDCCILPNSESPRTILTKQYINSYPGAMNHFYSSGLVGRSSANEYLLFSELSQTRDLYEMCDSYLSLASRSPEALKAFYDNDFTHFSSPGRRLQWRTLTNKPAKQNKVNKRLLFSKERLEDTQDQGISGIEQNREQQDYKSGQLLVGLWLKCLVQKNANSGQFENYVIQYADWLKNNQQALGGQLYDILPFNLIVDEQGDYQIIDPEWTIDQTISAEFVLFRALFWFGFHNRDLLTPLAAEHGLFSLNDFVEFGLRLAGYNSDTNTFSQIETNIQSAIETQFNKEAIQETLRLPLAGQVARDVDLPKPKAQVFFYNAEDGFDFENSVTLSTSKHAVSETLSFSLTELNLECDTLRIDPVDRGGFFRISDLSIINSTGQTVWSLVSDQDVVAEAKQYNAVFADSHLGSLFIALNDDPQLIFDLSQVTGLISNLSDAQTLMLSLTYYGSSDYALAMQQLGRTTFLQQQFIASQRRELEALKARYNELNDNFEFLKDNSVKQHAYIEELTEREARLEVKTDRYILEQQTLIRDQSDVIAKQLEMMTRTFKSRIQLFVKRLLNKTPVVEEQQDIEPIDTQEELSSQHALLTRTIGQNNEDYALWIKKHSLNQLEIERITEEIADLSIKPVFSIVVPVYNIDEQYLIMAVDSVRKQLYPHWELCLVDDASPDQHIRPLLKRLAALDDRIKIKLNKKNQGIAGASNDALAMSSGDFVGLLDHDDEISIDALYENAKVINQYPDVGFIYSDEDKITMQGERVDPFFKPDYSPDLLDSQNYICHFSVISRAVIEKINGFRLGYDGSQDHDIIIRAIEQAERVVHIPKVLYHWRKVPGSTADVYDSKNYAWEAGRKAVASRLERSGDAGRVELGPLQGTYRVIRDIVGLPKISIVIPFKDRPDLLETCLNSIIEKSTYQNYEIIGVSNNSEKPETMQLMEEFQEKYDTIKFVAKNVPFNFSLLCNYGVSQSTGDYVILLNNDIEIKSPDWMELLLEHAQRPDVGAVGGKLFFPDGRIQHAGVVAGLFGAAGHTHLYFGADNIGYYGGLMVTRNVSAVTGAMLMVSRKKYDEVSGLDENNLAVAYNDVDFCLKLLDQGYRNIFTPFCHAIHYESASRGYEDNPEKLARLDKEKTYFVNKWKDFLDQGDPYFNPNFDLGHFEYKIKL